VNIFYFPSKLQGRTRTVGEHGRYTWSTTAGAAVGLVFKVVSKRWGLSWWRTIAQGPL